MDGSADAAGSDARVADGGVDAGADAGVDAGAGECVAAPAEPLGAPADALEPPAVAHHASGRTLLVWVDHERERVHAVLREDDGSHTELGDLGGYALDPPAEPFSAASAIADADGFAVAWLERRLDDGSFDYAFRAVSLEPDGSSMDDTTINSALRIHYTDVDPKLVATEARRVLVYRGRTSDPLPETRLVHTSVPPAAGWTFERGTPEAVTWDGDALVELYEDEGTVWMRRTDEDGERMGDDVEVDAPEESSGSLRLAHIDGDLLVARGEALFRVDDTGARSGPVLALPTLRRLVGSSGEHALALINSAEVPTAVRIDGTPAEIDRLGLDESRTGIDYAMGAAAWSGMHWVVGWAHDVGLDDRARYTRFCD